MHAAERLLFRENLSNGHFAKVYTLEIYSLYGIRYTVYGIRYVYVCMVVEALSYRYLNTSHVCLYM